MSAVPFMTVHHCPMSQGRTMIHITGPGKKKHIHGPSSVSNCLSLGLHLKKSQMPAPVGGQSVIFPNYVSQNGKLDTEISALLFIVVVYL